MVNLNTIDECKFFILFCFCFFLFLVNTSEKAMAPHSSTLAWKIPWRRSLVGCSPRGCEESDTAEWLHFHFSLSCIGDGNGNPLQCPCLENPRDGGAWWTAVYGVAQSWTRLKWLSSSSSSSNYLKHCCISDTMAQQLYLFILFRKRISELSNLGRFSWLNHTVRCDQLHGTSWT